MASTAAIHTSVKQDWRERLLRNGVAAYYPLYALFRRKQSSWQLDSQKLLTYPSNSLGYRLGQFLNKHGFELYNKCENHDIFHIILNYDTSLLGELKLVFCLLGNRRYSLTNLLAGLGGIILYPAYWSEFKQAFLRGRKLPLFHSTTFITYLSQPFSLWCFLDET